MDNKNLLKLTAINLKLGSRGLTLNPDEARKLRDELQELLGPKTGDMPYYIQQPIWIDHNAEPWPDRWDVSYENGVTLTINV